MDEVIEPVKNEPTWYDNLAMAALTVVVSAVSTMLVEKSYRTIVIERRSKLTEG